MTAPDRFSSCARTDCVEVIRHTYDCFEVITLAQAESYAERLGLYFSGIIHR